MAIREATQYGPKSYDVALTDGRLIPATFLDGSRWSVADDHVTPDTVEILRAGVTAKEASDKAKSSSAAQAFEQAVAKLRAGYPYLTQGCGPVTAAKNIRAELKRAFPSIKFSKPAKAPRHLPELDRQREPAVIYAMPKSKPVKRGRGRPAIPGRFVVVKLEERLIAKAEKIGGKVTAGIREALERVKTS